jgi:hypothetical protein
LFCHGSCSILQTIFSPGLLGRISPATANLVSVVAPLSFLRATYAMREILSEVILQVVMP